MNLNPYQSPTIAGQPPAEVRLSFRRRYWFEMLMVSEAVLLVTVAIAHRSLRGVPELFHYRLIVLFVVGCWVSGPVLAIWACLRAILLLNRKGAWRGIIAASFAILVMLAHMTASWINPRMETATEELLGGFFLYFWLKGVSFP